MKKLKETQGSKKGFERKRNLDLREESVEAARLEVVVNGVVWSGVAAAGGGGGGSVPADANHSATTATIGPAASHVS